MKLRYLKYEIDGWESTIEGIILDESEKWILIRHIFSDYMLDGYALVKKKYIKQTLSDKLKEKVMLRKMGSDYKVPFDLKIKSSKQIIKSFENENLMIQIEDHDDSCCFIGKVISFTDKTFTIHVLTPKIKWDGEMTFKYKDIRALYFSNDYVETLDKNSK